MIARNSLVASASIVCVLAAGMAGADDTVLLRTITTAGEDTRAVPAGATIAAPRLGDDAGVAPTIRVDAASTDAAQPVIVELRSPSLVRAALQGRGTRAPRAARDALAGEHARVVDEILRLEGAGPLARAAGAIRREFGTTFNGIAATLSPATRAALLAHPDVKAIHPDPQVKATLDSSVPYVRAPTFWSQHGGYRGAGQVIAVLDTGVDYTHADLGACAAIGAGCKIAGGYDFTNDDADPMDDHGHGTHVAATAAGSGAFLGVAPDATVLAYKVLDAYGFGLTSTIMAGIEAAVDPDGDLDTSDHADVINLSLGGPGGPDDPGAQSVDAATAAGVLVVAAAGNDGDYFTIGSPGVARTALTVGAVSEDGFPAPFTSAGPTAGTFDLKPEIAAPGVDVCAARAEGTALGPTCLDEAHVSLQGTSMATPHVAGAAALLRGVRPELSPDDVKSLLAQNGDASPHDALQVGASILDVPRAASAHTVVSPQALSFGLDDLAQPVWTAMRTLTVRNVGTASRSYSVSAVDQASGLPAGATVAFSPSAFSLSPGQSRAVEVTLVVDNAVAPNQPNPPNAWEAMIELRASGETQRVPMIFLKTPLLRVLTDRVATMIYAHDRTSPYGARAVIPTSTTADLLLPAGVYDLIVLYPIGLGAFVVHEGVAVSGRHDESMPSTTAIHTVSLSGRSELGAPLQSSVRAVSLFHRASALGMVTLTSEATMPFSIAVSSIGGSYDLDLALLAQPAGRSYFVDEGLAGVSSSVALANDPGELTRGAFRYYANPGETPTGTMEFLSLMMGSSFGIGLGPPAVAPVDRDFWATPAPHAGARTFVQPVVLLTGGPDGAHSGPWYRGSTEPGVLQAFNVIDPNDFVYETASGELPLDLGPASLFARFANGSNWVSLRQVAAAWTWTFHSPGGDGPQAPGGTIGWRLLANDNPVASGVAPQSGFGGPFLPFVYPLAARAYVFETEPLPYWVGGVRASSRIAASFDLRRQPGDVDPPYLRRVEVRSGGALAEVVPVGGVPTVQIEAHDALDAEIALSLARRQGAMETPVAVVSLGDGAFEATLDGACDVPGAVALVVTAADSAGNELREWLDPAFVCRGAACGDGHLDPGEACDDGNRVSGDGCNAVCSSAGACGDGIVDDGEACDDGNASGGDCCSATCQLASAGAACDDGLFCNGSDRCDAFGACSRHGTDPCAGGPECASHCDDAMDSCGVAPAGSACSSDGNACTDDACDGAGACTHAPNTGACDDGVFCNGPDTCAAGACTVHAGDPCTGGSECADTCQEDLDTCFSYGTCSDDGEPCSIDLCNGAGACAHYPAYTGTVCRAASGACDVPEVCDGTQVACPPDTGIVDTDGDGLCDGLDPCTSVAGAQSFITSPAARLVVGKSFRETIAGNDTLSASGFFLLPATTSFAQLFPQGGVGRVVLRDAAGVARADVALPAEWYSSATRRGWTASQNGKSWMYRDRSDAPLGGITRLVARTTARFPWEPGSRVRLSITGKKGSFPFTEADLAANVTMTLGDQAAAASGRCAESTFSAVDCRLNGQRTQMTCRR